MSAVFGGGPVSVVFDSLVLDELYVLGVAGWIVVGEVTMDDEILCFLKH